MANVRLRGDDVVVSVAVDGAPIAALTNVQNFELMVDFEKKEENYLGEGSARFDEQYKGVSFKMEVHNSDPTLFDFFNLIKARAQHQTPGVQVNITASLKYAGQGFRTAYINDAFFEPMGLAFGGRAEYGKTSLSGVAQNVTVI
jgi:hypothetical protein